MANGTDDEMGSHTGGRYWSLDGMRGIAAVAVVIGHFRSGFAPLAHLAVDFFFMLSGFVLADAYRHRLEAGMGTRRFMQARLARLYPMYFVGMVIGFAQLIILMALGLRAIDPLDFLMSAVANFLILPSPSFFLLAAPVPGTFPINGPAWSLFWELAINLVFALILFRLSKFQIITITIMALVVLVATALHYGKINIGWNWLSWGGGAARVVFAFCAGLVLHFLIGKRRRRIHWSALIPMSVLVLCLILPLYGHARLLFEILFCGLIAPALITAGALIECPRNLVGICARFGYASYPLYIIHRGLIGLYLPLVHKLQINDVLACGAFVVFALIGATTISRFVDRNLGRHAA